MPVNLHLSWNMHILDKYAFICKMCNAKIVLKEIILYYYYYYSRLSTWICIKWVSGLEFFYALRLVFFFGGREYINFSRAFDDKVPFRRLLKKTRPFGFRGYLLQWIEERCQWCAPGFGVMADLIYSVCSVYDKLTNI